MTEQENYECFAIPSHVWVGHDVAVAQEPAGRPRRNGVYREVAMLGAEAIPSPPLELL
jgi:hypothetical protein